MKEHSFDFKGMHAGSSYTQLLWSNQMLNDIIKKGNEDVNLDVPDNMCDMLVTEFPSQRKDEKNTLINFKMNRRLVQTCEPGHVLKQLPKTLCPS